MKFSFSVTIAIPYRPWYKKKPEWIFNGCLQNSAGVHCYFHVEIVHAVYTCMWSCKMHNWFSHLAKAVFHISSHVNFIPADSYHIYLNSEFQCTSWIICITSQFIASFDKGIGNTSSIQFFTGRRYMFWDLLFVQSFIKSITPWFLEVLCLSIQDMRLTDRKARCHLAWL